MTDFPASHNPHDPPPSSIAITPLPFITWKASRVRIVAVRPRRPQRPRQAIFTQPSWNSKGWQSPCRQIYEVVPLKRMLLQRRSYYVYQLILEVSGSDKVSRNVILMVLLYARHGNFHPSPIRFTMFYTFFSIPTAPCQKRRVFAMQSLLLSQPPDSQGT